MTKATDGKWVQWQGVNEQGWYWHWNGDEDCIPVPVSVLYTPVEKLYFATMGQLGWTQPQNVEQLGGWWKLIRQMPIPMHLLKAPPAPEPDHEQ